MKGINFYRGHAKGRTLLLHYKTFNFKNRFELKDQTHTNVWEISEIVRVFLSRGWNVELVDRSVRNWSPSREYDLFISNASGNSGQQFCDMAKKIPLAYKVLYAAGPAADISNNLVIQRYESFYQRNPKAQRRNPLRIIDKIEINEVGKLMDEVVCIDDNGWSSSTYGRFNKPITIVRPSSPPNAFDPLQFLDKPITNRIVLFLGNGFIVKGADVAIEAIRSFPSTELVICGPYKADEVFWSTYKSEIKKHHSVKGFITIGSRAYWEIVRYATWQFHFSAAEGCATSLTTLMQSGVIPISNRESGLMVEGQGVDIVDSGNLVQDAVLALHQATSMTTQEIQEARTCLYEKAPRFSQVQFRLQFIDLVKAWEEKLQSR